jgi:hypothetical protein
MCCDGSLFSHGVLIDDEVDLARSLRMDVFQSGEGVFRFRQPCECFQHGSCSVYDQAKPNVCSTYRCELLNGCAAGTIDLESCRDVVGWMQGLKHELEAEMGLAFATFTYAQLVDFAVTVRPHEHPEEHERFMLACRRYLGLGKSYFRFPFDELAEIVADLEQTPVER